MTLQVKRADAVQVGDRLFAIDNDPAMVPGVPNPFQYVQGQGWGDVVVSVTPRTYRHWWNVYRAEDVIEVAVADGCWPLRPHERVWVR